MNQHEDIDEKQKDLLSVNKKVEYKQARQRYKNIITNSHTEEKVKQPNFDNFSLMKFDEESHINLSDSEKETQITQTTQNVENSEKINKGEASEFTQKMKYKNPNNRYQAFEKGIQIIQDDQQKLVKNTAEKKYNYQKSENKNDMKPFLANDKMKSFNIFSDQKLMNKQILDEILGKTNFCSLVEFQQTKDESESNLKDQQRSRGSFSQSSEQISITNKSKSPTRFIDYYKQIQQHNSNKSTSIPSEVNLPNHLFQNDFSKYANKLSDYQKESIPSSNASTVYSIQNNSDKYQMNSFVSQISTPKRQSPKNKQDSNQNTPLIKIQSTTVYSGNSQENNSISNDYLTVKSNSRDNQIRNVQDLQYAPNNRIVEIDPKCNRNVQEAVEICQNQADNEETYFAHQNNYENDSGYHNDIDQKQYQQINQKLDQSSKIVIPLQQQITQEKTLKTIQSNYNRKNSKQDHLLNEPYQFQNQDDKNIQVTVSSSELSPQKSKIQSEQNNSSLFVQPIRKPFSQLKKRPQRQQALQQDQKQSKVLQDSFLESNTMSTTLKNNRDYIHQNNYQDQNNEEQIDSSIDKQFVQKQNYDKMAQELQKNLSGNKNLLQQIEKIQINDQTLNENSFSDDSPQPFASNLSLKSHSQQNLSNTLAFHQKLQIKQQPTPQQKQGTKLTLQQFQTQIISDSNESGSDTSISLNQKNQMSESPQKIQKKLSVFNSENKDKVKGSLKQNNYPIQINKIIQDIYENDSNGNTPINEQDVESDQNRFNHENDLIIFSKDQLPSQPIQQNQQIDDFNNFLTPQSLLLISCLEELDDQSPSNSHSNNKIQHSVVTNNFSSPIQKSSIANLPKQNIIQFETDEESDNALQNKKKKDENNFEDVNQSDLGIISSFQMNTCLKQSRVHRFKAFSDNNTPINSQMASNEKQEIPQSSYSAEQTIKQFKGNMPQIIFPNSKYYQDSQEMKQNLRDNQISQVSHTLQPSIINQKNEFSIFIHPSKDFENKYQLGEFHNLDQIQEYKDVNCIFKPTFQQQFNHYQEVLEDEQKRKIVDETEEYNRKKEEQNKMKEDPQDTNSCDDGEDFDDDEDEEDEDFEFDLNDDDDEDEVVEGNPQIMQSIQHRKLAHLKQEELQKEHKQDNQTDKQKYDQREIGIGKYFCEKLFNVYGDNKLFQKKKKNLKKWHKMIQIAEDRLKIKSYIKNDQIQINNNQLLNPTQILQSTSNQSNILGQNNNHQNETGNQKFQQKQKDINLNNINQIPHKVYDEIGSTYSQRIRVYQQKLIDQNQKKAGQGEQNYQDDCEDQALKCQNDDDLSAEEEFYFIYYFKTIQKNEFLKALRKGPPMWYRWSAWKVAVDLNLEEYKSIYEELKPDCKININCTQPMNPIDKQINKDVSRTFPCESFFSDPRYENQSLESLRSVLKAISVYFDKVGYCQGMNFFAAYILLINGGDELQTFAMLIQMDKRFNIMSLFEEDFPLLQFMNFVFYREFGRKFQKLCRHFNLLKIPETMWVVQWFQTLFLNSLSLNVVCRFWDYIFYSGCILSVISISLSLIHEFNSHLLKMNLDEISNFTQKLKSCSVVKGEMRNSPFKPKPLLSPLINFLQKDQLDLDDNLIIDPEKIIKRAKSYTIPKKDIISYINEFKQLNCLYKDKSFLRKMEDQLNSESINIKAHNLSPSQSKKQQQIRQVYSQQNTPKKKMNDQELSEIQSLLHPYGKYAKKSQYQNLNEKKAHQNK